MADGLFDNVYNPDVLSCLANLSNDEVFTPPDIVNQMLDMLPQELFRNPGYDIFRSGLQNGSFPAGNCKAVNRRSGTAVPGPAGTNRPHFS